jgi:ribosome-binding protein aMBF1 (putative translation factor)
MKAYIVTERYVPSIFSDVPIIKAGWRILEKPGGRYRVTNESGTQECEITPAMLKAITGKREIDHPGDFAVMADIGKQLRSAREKRGFTLDVLAGKMGASRQYIHRIEMGKAEFSINQLKKLCDALNFELKIKITRSYEKETKTVKEPE